jgi:hypothetical protein
MFRQSLQNHVYIGVSIKVIKLNYNLIFILVIRCLNNIFKSGLLKGTPQLFFIHQ